MTSPAVDRGTPVRRGRLGRPATAGAAGAGRASEKPFCHGLAPNRARSNASAF